MTKVSGVHEIPHILATLRSARPSSGILSVYLDTSPGRMLNDAYLLALRDACKELRPRLPSDQSECFELARVEVEHFLSQDFTPSAPGVAVFATPPPGQVLAVNLPDRPLDELTWAERPALSILQAMFHRHERIALALVDKTKARLFTVFLDAVEEKRELEDYVPGRHKSGGWHLLSQSRAQRHREDRLAVHVRHTIEALMELLGSHPFDRLLLAGPDEAIAVVRSMLPRPLRSRLAGTLAIEMFAGDAKVVEVARQAANRIEREYEVTVVSELLDADPTERAVLGLRATLTALDDGRVLRLVVADSLASLGAECVECGRLVVDGDGCASCGGQPGTQVSLRDLVVEHALQQGGQVEIVGGEAADNLMPHEGIGAFTRFAAVSATT